VWVNAVYGAKPDLKVLFPVPSNTQYERHLGPVTGMSSNPFLKRLFLTSSQDGSVRLFDV